jgi:hypothetical protein
LNTAAETIQKLYGFSPYMFAFDKNSYYYQSKSEQILLATIGWSKKEFERELGVSLVATDAGFGLRVAKPLELPYASCTFGAFILQSPYTIQNAFGAQAHVQIQPKGGKPLFGALKLPNIDFAYVTLPHEQEPTRLMGRLTPIELDIGISKGFSMNFTPISLEGAATPKLNKGGGKGGSSLGFIYSQNEFGKVYGRVNVGWAPSEEAYDLKLRDNAPQFVAGAEFGKTKIEARYAPKNVVGGKFELDASQKFRGMYGVNVLVFANVRSDLGQSSGGIQLNYSF